MADAAVKEPLQSVQVFGRKKSATAVAYCKRGKGLIKVTLLRRFTGSFIRLSALYTNVPFFMTGEVYRADKMY